MSGCLDGALNVEQRRARGALPAISITGRSLRGIDDVHQAHGDIAADRLIDCPHSRMGGRPRSIDTDDDCRGCLVAHRGLLYWAARLVNTLSAAARVPRRVGPDSSAVGPYESGRSENTATKAGLSD
ncbi:hypothetical protein I551_3809 [Mycobacterium ulcerans str. Harvey]|uniref:Uncharacterized protein n=1 Tax=Mycobacterium ulcerans str. Harvey TaxID=1299332 RepID=A0ABP3AHF4_MYCUL|nr:hypothetical protein I551_3809 [Mycobacterium ulcerans str. Harvey]